MKSSPECPVLHPAPSWYGSSMAAVCVSATPSSIIFTLVARNGPARAMPRLCTRAATCSSP